MTRNLSPIFLAVFTALAACARVPHGGVAGPIPAGADALSKDGNYVKAVLVRGSPEAELLDARAHGAEVRGGIAVMPRPDGESVFVSDLSGLHEYDGATGALRGRTDIASLQSGPPAAHTLSRDGHLLVLSSASSNRVLVWDPAAQRLLEDHTNFRAPVHAIRFQGDLVVAELRSTSVVRKRAGETDPVTLVTGMRAPAGLAATTADLWVADRASGTILEIVQGGVGLPEPIEVATGLVQPVGLAGDTDGSLYVVEAGARRLLRINPKTHQAHVIDEPFSVGGEPPPGPAQPRPLVAVAVGACGTLYVTTDVNDELLRYAPRHRQGCR